MGYNFSEHTGYNLYQELENDFEINGVQLPGIVSKARWVAWKYGLDPQDAAQDIMLALLELNISKPELGQCSPAYLLQAATWQVAARERREYSRGEISVDNRYFDYMLLDEESEGCHEILAAPEPDQDSDRAAAVQAVQDAAVALGERYEAIVFMLGFGMQKQEVAAALGISGAAISGYVKRLRNKAFALLAAG